MIAADHTGRIGKNTEPERVRYVFRSSRGWPAAICRNRPGLVTRREPAGTALVVAVQPVPV